MSILAHLRWPWRRRGAPPAPPAAERPLGANGQAAVAAVAASAVGRDLAEELSALDFRAPSAPRVSVVIPVFDQIRHTAQCLKSLALAPSVASFEIVIGDDGSTDDTATLLPALRGIKYVRTDVNRGFVATCNAAAAQAAGDFVVLLNNDTVVLPGWLDALIDTFAEHPRAGLVGSMLLWPHGRLQEAGALVARDGTGWNVGRDGDADDWRYNHLREVDYCSGASIAVPRALWQALGGFDADFAPGYYEDTDLAFRVRAGGRLALYQPASRVVHFEGVSAGRSVESGMKRAMADNRPRFAAKWSAALQGHVAADALGTAPIARAAKGRVLWIDTVALTPAADAGSLYSWEFIALLREQGWSVDFLPAEHLAHYGAPTAAMQRAGIGAIYAPEEGTAARYVEARAKDYGLVIVTRLPAAEMLFETARRSAPGTRLLFNTVDLYHVRAARQAAVTGEAAVLAQAAAWRRAEIRIAGLADATIVVSDAEAALLRREGVRAPLHVIPLIQRDCGRSAGFEARADLCFLGSYDHPPNGDAVRHFCAAIWPRVAAALPAARFEIVGAGAQRMMAAVQAERIVPVGFVPDLAAVFDRIRVSVAPLRFGAGMKGKIVTSLAHGVPVVTTSIGAEGIGLRHEHDALIADEPDAFAAAVVRLYTSPDLWEALSRNGMALVRARFSREAAAARIAAVTAR